MRGSRAIPFRPFEALSLQSIAGWPGAGTSQRQDKDDAHDRADDHRPQAVQGEPEDYGHSQDHHPLDRGEGFHPALICSNVTTRILRKREGVTAPKEAARLI